MEFEFLPAVIAGFAGGLVMTVMMTMARSAGLTRMDMSLIEGAFFTDDEGKAKAIGAFMHLVVMSGLLFGSIYAVLFSAFDVASDDAWWYGLAFGGVHAVVAGVGMAMMPMMHPKMTSEPVPAAATSRLRLQPPGPFAVNMGKPTPVGLIMAHVAYGLVVALVYAALV
jgi:hypothetical protein